jgi:type II secretory pathway pseudopilin PulG
MSDTPAVPPALPPGAAPAPSLKPATLHGCVIAAFIGVAVLAVVGVVAILVALAIPAFRAVKDSAREVNSRRVAHTVADADLDYVDEYDRFPSPGTGSNNESTPLRTEADMVRTLDGSDTGRNPKQIAFLPHIDSAILGNRPGIIPGPEGRRLVDAWGEAFYALIDVDGDGQVLDPDLSSGSVVLERVLVFSAGPDRDPSTWADNITTWE